MWFGPEQLNICKSRFKFVLLLFSGFGPVCGGFQPTVCIKQELNPHIALLGISILGNTQAMCDNPACNCHKSS